MQTWTLFLIVWTEGGLTGSRSELQFRLRVSFDAQLNSSPGAHVCLEHFAFVSNVHILTLSRLLLLTPVLFPETWKLRSF